MPSWSLGACISRGAQAQICEVQGLVPLAPEDARLFPSGTRFIAKVMRSEEYPANHRKSPESCEPLISSEVLRTAVGVARVFHQLRHENVIRYVFIEVSATFDELIVIMPQMAGDLSSWLNTQVGFHKQEKIPQETWFEIAKQVAAGLNFLHNNNIAHLDMKIDNVLVSDLRRIPSVPHCVITDFETSTAAGSTATDSFTEHFAAPERIKGTSGMSHQDLVRCDCWSLGMTLFVVGAAHEFPGLVSIPDIDDVIMMNHQSLTPSIIAAVVRRDLAHFSDSAVSFITMMLNHDPKTRPSVRVVMDNLEALGNASQLTFPFVLGPFSLYKEPSGEMEKAVAVYTQSDMYDFHSECYKCCKKRSASKLERSDCRAANGMTHMPAHTSPYWRCSPLLPCLENLNLPASATARFLYPFQCDRNAHVSQLKGLLQVHGGFAMLTKEGKEENPDNVLVLALRNSQGKSEHEIFFSAAQPFPSECTAELHRASRIFEEVPSMLGEAKCFCWILPGEDFTLSNGEKWIAAPDGGFVFWFNSNPLEPHELDRFFAVSRPVAKSASYKPRAGKASQHSQSLPEALVHSISNLFSSQARAVCWNGHTVTFSQRQATWTCDACGRVFDRVSVPRYSCQGCNFDLCQECNAVAIAQPDRKFPPPPVPAGEPKIVLRARWLREVQFDYQRYEFQGKEFRRFSLPSTGEFGNFGKVVFVSEGHRRALGTPQGTQYIAFCMTLTGLQARKELLLPHYGLGCFDVADKLIGLIAFRFTDAEAQPPGGSDFGEIVRLRRVPPVPAELIVPSQMDPPHKLLLPAPEGRQPVRWLLFNPNDLTFGFAFQSQEMWFTWRL